MEKKMIRNNISKILSYLLQEHGKLGVLRYNVFYCLVIWSCPMMVRPDFVLVRYGSARYWWALILYW